MKTREQIYGQEAGSILRDISMYGVLLEEQLLRLYPGKRAKVRNLLSYLTKQGRIWSADGAYCASPELVGHEDWGMIAALWVLVDFIDRVEYHIVGEYPAKVVFFADGELYEVIYAACGKEALVNYILSVPAKEFPQYIVLVDKQEQITELDIPGVSGFCTVAPNGEVSYYQKE